MLVPCLLLLLPCQDPKAPGVPATVTALRVTLEAKAPGGNERLGWSPKGASVALRKEAEALRGEFPLGPAEAPKVAVELTRSAGSAHFDRLAVDCDRSGAFTDDERFTTVPKDNRGKWWSSFEATVQVPFGPVASATSLRNPYPLALWFVADPQEPDAPPALRWSRRGWHEGSFEWNGKPVHVLITEGEMDGVFTTADSWQIGADRQAMLRAESRNLGKHAWLAGQAFRATEVAADGRTLALESFDPGISEAAERDQADRLKADRTARRTAAPLAFGKDLDTALAEAQRTGKRVFVDFETTWCGPCKEMDRLVYTAADVVTAAADLIAVKLDGDEQRALVKRYEVKGYPTLLLLDGKGEVQRRLVGYQGVAAMVQFFAK